MTSRRKVSNALGLAVLGLLTEAPMHPHAMASTLRERGLDRAFKLTTGSLYDVVRALERAEWIEAVETLRVGARPERTVYRTTALGAEEFVRWIDELLRVPSDEFPKFVSAVSYLGALAPDAAATALRERVDRLRVRRDEVLDGHRAALDSGAVPRLFVLEAEYAVHMLDAELGWLDGIIAEIETGSLTWPDAGPNAGGAA